MQVGFDIPPAEPSKLKQIFLQRTKSLGLFTPSNEEDAIRWIQLETVGFYKLIRTPRDVVRYANGLVVNGGIVKDEVNPVDFAVLEAIRTFAPELYSFIRENREVFIKPSAGTTFIDRGPDPETYQGQLEKALCLCLPELKDALRAICRQLFPEIEVLHGNQPYGSGVQEGWRRAKRICTVEFFPRYFYLRPSEQEVSQTEFEAIVGSGNDHATLVAQLLKLIASGKMDNFLQRIGDSHTEVPERNVQPIVSALFDVGDRMTTGLHSDNQLLRVSGAVQRLLLRQEQFTRLSILHSVAMGTASLGAVVYFARLWDQSTDPELKLIDEKGWEEIQNVLVGRIRSAAKDMTLAESPHLAILLYRWREWGLIEEVQDFVGRLVESDEGVLVFLQGMMAETSTSVGMYAARRGWRIPVEDISEFVDLDPLNESVQRIKKERKDGFSEREQAALQAFLEGMAPDSLEDVTVVSAPNLSVQLEQ